MKLNIQNTKNIKALLGLRAPVEQETQYTHNPPRNRKKDERTVSLSTIPIEIVRRR